MTGSLRHCPMPMLKLYSPTGSFGDDPNRWSQMIMLSGLSLRDEDGERRAQVLRLSRIVSWRAAASGLHLLEQPPLTPETLWLTSFEPTQDF